MRIGATPDHLSAVRAVAGDSLDDFKMAVDEACAALIPLAAPGTMLTCVFHPAPELIRVVTQVTSRSAALPSQSGFGWRVLTALTDAASASAVRVPQAEDGYRIRIEFTCSPVRSRPAAGS